MPQLSWGWAILPSDPLDLLKKKNVHCTGPSSALIVSVEFKSSNAEHDIADCISFETVYKINDYISRQLDSILGSKDLMVNSLALSAREDLTFIFVNAKPNFVQLVQPTFFAVIF